jgi:hypothetical protein
MAPTARDRTVIAWPSPSPSRQPDLPTLVVLMGGLLLVTAALRLGALLRHVPGTPQEGPATGTTPTEAAPSSTPVMDDATGHRGRSHTHDGG